MADPYQVLGVRPGDSVDVIRKAYRKAARAWHPDLHPDDPTASDRFKEVAAAWQVLNDPEARARLDAKRGTVPGGAPEVAEGYAARLSDALQRAQDWLDRAVLPRVASAWRGAGAEALAQALVELDETLTPGPLPTVGWAAARRAERLSRELNIAIDPFGSRPLRFLRHRNGWSLVFGAQGFEREVPERELDDLVLRLLVETSLRCLLAPRLRLDPAHPELVAEARRHDATVVQQRRNTWMLWGGVLLAIGAMILWAAMSRPPPVVR